jgi:hypothetical protein
MHHNLPLQACSTAEQMLDPVCVAISEHLRGQGDQISLWKKSPKMLPKRLLVKNNT